MEKQELEVCINAYGKALYSFCRQLAGNRQEADELYQDTFLRAMELSEKVDYTGNPKSYLLSAALSGSAFSVSSVRSNSAFTPSYSGFLEITPVSSW